MAVVYILYSESLAKFYIGNCFDFDKRIVEHNNKTYDKSYTAKVNDWETFHLIDQLTYKQARKIELHIKSMKSNKYNKNLKLYPEIIQKLIQKYSAEGDSDGA